ncbi:hypothetical protein Tcan_06081 [Toxocara canis]|uniref:Glycine N-acyltransferase-like protein n=1 Tax=Toxocara canis TaxID=6265 RepID=A0A0B2VIS5_TOXCA|nr:hypothetical protein Tcan_06081 [Toxocara canis]
MTLYEFVSDEDMHEAMRKTDHHPHCMPVFYSIRHHLTARFPAGPIRLFGYPSENPSLWFVLRQNIHVNDHILIWPSPHAVIAERQFDDAFKQFCEQHPIRERNVFLVIGNLTEMFLAALRSNYDFIPTVYPTHMYYMNNEQQKLVNELELKLPSGYYFDDVNPSRDASIINGTWIHAREGDLQQTTEKLKCLPSAIIRCGNEAISFEMCDPSGFQNHLFTIEQHRRKGLGAAVELRLSQKCIR